MPFQADTPFAVIHDHIYAPLPLPRSIRSGFPETLERVLLKALAKERDDRYASMAELLAAFESAAQTITSEAPTHFTDQPMVVPTPIVPPAASTVAAPPTPPPVAQQLNPRAPNEPQQSNRPLPDLAPLDDQFAHANELIGQNKPDQASAEFRQVAQNVEPLVRMAAVHLLQDRLDTANEALDRAIRLNPDLNSAHLLKACVLNKQNERVLALREIRLGGGAEALVKMPPWMRPVLNRMECTPERFT